LPMCAQSKKSFSSLSWCMVSKYCSQAKSEECMQSLIIVMWYNCPE
jgi:hypothetical protein